MITSGKKWNF